MYLPKVSQLSLLLVLLVFSSCDDDFSLFPPVETEEDEPITEIPIPPQNPNGNDDPATVDVDPELQIYYSSFVAEALERGWEVDVSHVSGAFTELNGDAAGVCSFSPSHANEITIDRSIWNSISGNLKELIMYHELGHCVLYRDHREAASNGTCLSIMRSGIGGCFDNYNINTREAYLDELFDPDFFNELLTLQQNPNGL